MISVYKAPESWKYVMGFKHIFLAGSIEMGTAENWQDRLTNRLKNEYDKKNIVILNPRRDDWDSSWEQDKNNPKFFEQVTWELDSLEGVDIIPMYFDENTKSPITLLELGLFADRYSSATDQKIIVYCPKGFWRKGNVDIVCSRYGIQVFENEETWFNAIVSKL